MLRHKQVFLELPFALFEVLGEGSIVMHLLVVSKVQDEHPSVSMILILLLTQLYDLVKFYVVSCFGHLLLLGR